MVEVCLCYVLLYYSECFCSGCCLKAKGRCGYRYPFAHCAVECLKSNVVVVVDIADIVVVVVH